MDARESVSNRSADNTKDIINSFVELAVLGEGLNIIEDAWMWAVTQLRKVAMIMSDFANDVGDLDHEIRLGMGKNNEYQIIIHVT